MEKSYIGMGRKVWIGFFGHSMPAQLAERNCECSSRCFDQQIKRGGWPEALADCLQGSSTLHILRTPMPFGSPVPYPHSNGSPIAGAADAEAGGPASMQPGQGGIPSLAYTLPYELR